MHACNYLNVIILLTQVFQNIILINLKNHHFIMPIVAIIRKNAEFK